MKHVSERYQRQLDDLAEMLCRPAGAAALQETVELESNVIQFPTRLRLLEPPERGWEQNPDPEAA